MGFTHPTSPSPPHLQALEIFLDTINAPIFQRIKDFILQQIADGVWKEGDQISSESVLASQFETSRMTVNRAVRELTADQVLNRIQGSGTYVAQQKVQATLVEIRSIAEEVRARGHVHRSELHKLERGKAGEVLARQFDMKAGRQLFHSVIVHFENDIPIQVEDRWVNAKVAPAYMEQDFSSLTPNEYLMAAAPLQGMDYRIEAVVPPAAISTMLHIDAAQPCLVLWRRTRAMGEVATVTTMWHPGNRYQFTGGF